ncbi:MAG: TIGR03619 family F420-dependent LLM class oxidoreductase [Chloroflexi bacterium]|nr:TIGR03619 family F420-dependent LLM class oxidoreductase [Chloroflexota bacterium]
MDFGVFLPVSGRATGRDTLTDAARRAEGWGFGTVWAAERIVIPWQIETAYPYAEGSAFIVPPDRPFLESLTCLAFLAGCTETIKLGVSTLVLPYRHPLQWAKVATSIDTLSEGRLVLGVGVGWMVEEFGALGAHFAERGAVSDEQLEILQRLLNDERCSYEGRFYQFRDLAFYPKAYRQTGIPVWVGGEGRAAQRRTARYGDAWFPYFVRITPRELAARFDNVRAMAAEHGREADQISLACCLPIVVTDGPVPQDDDRLRGSAEQLVEAVRRFAAVGVEHLALQFMVPRYPERLEQIERFATEVLPHLR